MPYSVRTRLSAMMFLFFFSVGAWVVTLPTYLLSAPIKGGLSLSTAEVGWVSSAMAISAMIAQPIVGLLADRLFRADRVLAVACFGCAALLAVAGWWCDRHFPRVEAVYRETAATEVIDGRPVLDHVAGMAALGEEEPPAAARLRADIEAALNRVKDAPAVRQAASDAFGPLFLIMLLQCFGAQLGSTLTTVIALRNLPDPSGQFARVRLWGTVGWVISGNAIGLFLVAVSAQPLYLAAGSAALTGAFALCLPPTPPKGGGKTLRETFGLPALAMLRDRAFVVFLAVAFGSAVMNQFYVTFGHRYMTDLGLPRPEQVMTVAQVVEVGCMFVVPMFHPRNHVKALLAVGLAGFAVRAAAMASLSPVAVVAVAIPMHGVCYTFFSIVAAIFVDREAPSNLRASAQAVMSFVTAGIGPWTGNLVAASFVEANRFGPTIDWRTVWLLPLAVTTALLVAFVALFRPHFPADEPRPSKSNEDAA